MIKKEDMLLKLNKGIISSEEKNKIICFLEKYQDNYDEPEKVDFIIDILSEKKDYKEYSLIRQILDATNLYVDKENPFLNYLKIFEQYFSYDQNIVDIAAGDYPAEAFRIRDRQRRGTLTVYEPSLIIKEKELNGIKLIKDKFTMDTDIKDKDLLFGILTCEATETMIRKANLDHKNLFLGLCGCTHYDVFDMQYMWGNISSERWQEDMYNLLMNTNEDYCDIKIIPSQKEQGIEYPILIKKIK